MARELIGRLRQALGDRYTVITEVGRGGNATLYGAYDRDGRKVAIKVLHPELAVSVAADRFLREMRYAAAFDHPHIAPLLDSGETDYLLWFVMPFVAGETLRKVLRRERMLPIDRAVQVATEVLDALGHAHQHGFAHRDIKPDNIVLSSEGDGAILVDFGIARAIASSGEDRVTRSGFVVGTEEYMSPEQAGGHPDIDGRTDLYSLGVFARRGAVRGPHGPAAVRRRECRRRARHAAARAAPRPPEIAARRTSRPERCRDEGSLQSARSAVANGCRDAAGVAALRRGDLTCDCLPPCCCSRPRRSRKAGRARATSAFPSTARPGP